MVDQLFQTKYTVDTSDFDAAIKAFSATSKRTLPEIINKQLGNWAFEAAKHARATAAESIRFVPSSIKGGKLVWWRFVQSVINSGTFVTKRRVKAVGMETSVLWQDPATRQWMKSRKTRSEFRNLGWKDAFQNGVLEKVSQSILRRRAATVKSFRSQFLMAALRLGKNVATVGGKNSWKFRGIDTRLAGVADDSAFFTIPWRARTLENKKHEGDLQRRQAGKVTIALDAINKGKAVVVADVKAETERRLSRLAANPKGGVA